MSRWIPVVVAVVSALISGYFAQRSRAAELQGQRIVDLEKRLAAAKGEVFEPLIEAIGRLWDRIAKGDDVPPQWFETAFSRFGHWVQVYGDDESVRAYHRYMQAIYANAPVTVTMRVLGELILVARRELGRPDTSIDAADIMGIRITDLYEDGVPVAWARLPLDEVFASEGWVPPWGDRFK